MFRNLESGKEKKRNPFDRNDFFEDDIWNRRDVLGEKLMKRTTNDPHDNFFSKDFTGMSAKGPGNKFATLDEAAVDFALCYNGISIINNLEVASALYRNKDGSYSYTVPTGWVTFDKNGYRQGNVSMPNYDSVPYDAVLVGAIHTHGADRSGRPVTKYMNEDNKMNDQGDKWPAQNGIEYREKKGFKILSYLVTPNGKLLNYNVFDVNNQKKFRDGRINIGGNNIPSDPLSPTRINTVSPNVCPNIDPVVIDNNTGNPTQLSFPFDPKRVF